VVAGDSNQSIYEQDPSYREHIASSSEIQRILSSEDYELGIIHRLSKSIINVVQKFLPKMNIFNAKMDLTKQTTQVRICEADNRVEEVKYIIKKAKEAINNGQTVAILLPSQKMIVEFVQETLRNEGKSQWSARTNQYGKMDFGNLNSHCSHNNIPLQYIGNGYGGFSENSRKITLMTYHSAKGLQFETVILPYCQPISMQDESARKALYVAMTRTYKELYMMYIGDMPSPLNKVDKALYSTTIF
jgi:superfamily I DNA/RNA helicase